MLLICNCVRGFKRREIGSKELMLSIKGVITARAVKLDTPEIGFFKSHRGHIFSDLRRLPRGRTFARIDSLLFSQPLADVAGGVGHSGTDFRKARPTARISPTSQGCFRNSEQLRHLFGVHVFFVEDSRHRFTFRVVSQRDVIKLFSKTRGAKWPYGSRKNKGLAGNRCRLTYQGRLKPHDVTFSGY
jgi:hypothetical protein